MPHFDILLSPNFYNNIFLQNILYTFYTKLGEEAGRIHGNCISRVQLYNDDVYTDEQIYKFWIFSIIDEIKAFNIKLKKCNAVLTRKNVLTTVIDHPNKTRLDNVSVVLNEYENIIKSGRYDLNIFNPEYINTQLLIYYEINTDNKIIYIGSITYKIDEKTLSFISIYKSDINKCNTCSINKFHKIMLNYIVNKAIENNCIQLSTHPIGIMREKLEEFGFVGYTYNIESENNKRSLLEKLNLNDSTSIQSINSITEPEQSNLSTLSSVGTVPEPNIESTSDIAIRNIIDTTNTFIENIKLEASTAIQNIRIASEAAIKHIDANKIIKSDLIGGYNDIYYHKYIKYKYKYIIYKELTI
jgi:hypothetical protein